MAFLRRLFLVWPKVVSLDQPMVHGPNRRMHARLPKFLATMLNCAVLVCNIQIPRKVVV